MSGTERPARIELMDALRGLAVCLMVLHHFLYDLCAFLGAPWWLFTNPVFDVLHYFFAGLFIFLSGISSDFSRSNLKRGAKAMALALGITLVTYFMNMTIVFGVLHLLASCMLLFGLTRGFWEALPAWVLPVLCLALIFLTAPCADGVTTQTPQLWLFGFTTPDFASADYFPLLPGFGWFLLGAVIGRTAYRKKQSLLPRVNAANPVIRFFSFCGRHSLLIYMLHQPVLTIGTILIFG